MQENVVEKRKRFIPIGHSSGTECYVERAEGARVYDIQGREYIDFAGGIAVMNVGHSHPKVVAAIQDQAAKFTHTCFMVLPYGPAVELAEKLCDIVPGHGDKKALLVNSGAEAVENAVKISRYATGRSGIIAFENAFHGRTLLTMTLTSKVQPYKLKFGPFAPEVYRIPFAYCYRCAFGLSYPGCNLACADYLEKFLATQAAPETTAALIVEPIQGEGGDNHFRKEFFKELRRLCTEHDAMFMVDEVQSGVGLTGMMWAHEHFDVKPDILAFGKKTQVCGIMVGEKVDEVKDNVFSVSSRINSTWGGNLVDMVRCQKYLEVIKNENLIKS